jgi:predicted MFS family arabinose efflux permease
LKEKLEVSMSVNLKPAAAQPLGTGLPLTKGLISLLALAGGVSVANLYYSQPLLVDIANTFHIQSSKAGIISTLTQLGYAAGVFLFVPLGDIMDKRKIILALVCLVAISLMGVALAPGVEQLYVFSFCVGLTTGIPQIIVPLAAQLASPEQRGKIIGTIVSANLIGILLARTVSGSLGFLLGWRPMFVIAAVVMGCLGVILYFKLPKVTSFEKLSYKELLRSLFALIKKYPVLRRGAVTGAMMFGSFSVFWTSLTFLLKSPSFNMNSNQIGLFGLVGAVGALGARIIGGLNDKKDSRILILGCVISCVVAYIVLGFASSSIFGIILGIIVLDFGIQGTMVSTQSLIYSLSDSERSRLNTVFIVSNFMGGALGSALGAMAWNLYHWTGVCIVGTIMLLIALCVNLKAKNS